MSSSAAAPSSPLPLFLPQIPALDDTLGALFLGTIAGTLMYGLLLHQMYHYYRGYTKDPMLLKAWVAFVVAIETFTIIAAAYESYHYAITNWSNPLVLLLPVPPILPIVPAIASLSPLAVEIFFARRVWLLGPRYRPVVVVAVCLCFGFYGCYVAMAVVGFNQSPQNFLQRTAKLAGIGAVLVGAGNFLTTSVLIYVLHKSRSGTRRTDSIVEIIIKYAVTTGLLIFVVLTANVITCFVLRDTMVWLGMDFFLSKLDACVLLTALNTRNHISSSFHATFKDIPPSAARSTLHFRARGHATSASSATARETRIELGAVTGSGSGSGDGTLGEGDHDHDVEGEVYEAGTGSKV